MERGDCRAGQGGQTCRKPVRGPADPSMVQIEAVAVGHQAGDLPSLDDQFEFQRFVRLGRVTDPAFDHPIGNSVDVSAQSAGCARGTCVPGKSAPNGFQSPALLNALDGEGRASGEVGGVQSCKLVSVVEQLAAVAIDERLTGHAVRDDDVRAVQLDMEIGQSRRASAADRPAVDERAHGHEDLVHQ